MVEALRDALRDALMRQAGLAGRYAVNGVAGLGAALANPLALALNYGLEKGGSDYRFPDQYQALQSAMTQMGLPEPQGALEKGVGFASELGVPDPSDSARVVAGISNLIDPSMVERFPDLIQAMTVFHGSPHKWDKPDLSKVGTGEGAQAYGHGFYAAENPGVAKTYKRQLSDTVNTPDNTPYLEKRVAQMAVNFGGDDPVSWLSKHFDKPANHLTPALTPEVARTVADKFKSGEFTPGGHLYELDLPDETIDKMLDWDKPLSEQPEAVTSAIVNSGLADDPSISSGSMTGAALYKRLANEAYASGKAPERSAGVLDPQAAASKRLAELGIPGIKYLDGTSRSATPPHVKEVGGKYEVYWGNDPKPADVFDTADEAQAAARELDGRTRNFVIFDEQNIKPLTRNGEPIAPNLRQVMNEMTGREKL